MSGPSWRSRPVVTGLDPVIHAVKLPPRGWEHREGIVGGFTKTYGLKRLVCSDEHETVLGAIQRERNIKHWSRAWKVRLILEGDPGLADLCDTLT